METPAPGGFYDREYKYIYRNKFSDHDIHSLQICFMRQNLNPQETNKY